MMSTIQREILAMLAELCELSPDIRFGQLLAHLGFLGEDQTGRTLWDIDDEQLLAVLDRHRQELTERGARSETAPNAPGKTGFDSGPVQPAKPMRKSAS